MANSRTDSNQIDRLSNLPEALLLTIISFLPTHIAARTSVLCRRFRHLWEASPSLALISRDPSSKNFVAMAESALLRHNPSHSLLSLHLEVSCCHRNISFLSSLLVKARSLDLRHLTFDGCWFSIMLTLLPIIFTINSLRCLSLRHLRDVPIQEFNFPSGITLTCLRSLSLRLFTSEAVKLNPLFSELCSLEDLQLIITGYFHQHDNVVLSLPSLESLHLEFEHGICLSHIYGEVPLLRKAVINLHDHHGSDVHSVIRLLNCISHVEKLSLRINKIEDKLYPIPSLLELEKGVSFFPKLKHLDATLCFHKHNLEAITTMLQNCPVLESLKLVHEVPKITGSARGRKREDWESKLPLNADGNYDYAYFKISNEIRKEVIKLLSKECSSKRQARSS